MNRFGVTPEKERELLDRMAACGLREPDIKEHFVRGRGPGGQKINRTAVCVCLLHIPSGLSVKVQQARSQALNRFFARRRLCEALEAAQGIRGPKRERQEKLRKQKARRLRRHRDSEPAQPE